MNPDTNKLEKLTCQVCLGRESGCEHCQPIAQDKSLRRIDESLRRIKDFVDKNTKGANWEPLLRPDGTPVPDHWCIFSVDEHVVIKGYTFVIRYIGETSILLEPVGPVLVTGEGAPPLGNEKY